MAGPAGYIKYILYFTLRAACGCTESLPAILYFGLHTLRPAGHQQKTLMFKIAPGDFVEPMFSHCRFNLLKLTV